MRLDQFNNSWYHPGSLLKRALWYFMNLLFIKNQWNPFNGLKRGVLKLFGATIGKGVIIKPSVNIKYPWKLEIGDHVWIGEGVWIDNLGMVKIDSHVCISQGALLLTGNHNYKKITFDLMIGDIIIEEGVWIGARSIVGPGVHCKAFSILTIGSVAVDNLELNSIYQGNPAKKIRERTIEA